MYTAVLQINHSAEGSWEFLPNDLWQILLDYFIADLCTSIGFSGINTISDLSKIDCFCDWQPEYLGKGRVVIKWKNAYSKEITKEDEFGLFVYTDMVLEKIRPVQVYDWESCNDLYPVDELYFFRDGRVLMIATPYEGSVMFCNLTDDEKGKLLKIDKRVPPNLHELPDRTIFSELIQLSL